MFFKNKYYKRCSWIKFGRHAGDGFNLKKDVDVKKGIIIGATHKPRQLNILLNHVQVDFKIGR